MKSFPTLREIKNDKVFGEALGTELKKHADEDIWQYTIKTGKKFHFYCRNNKIEAHVPAGKKNISILLPRFVVLSFQDKSVETKKNILKNFIQKMDIKTMAISRCINTEKALEIEYVNGETSILKRIDKNDGWFNDTDQGLTLISNQKNFKHYESAAKIYKAVGIHTDETEQRYGSSILGKHRYKFLFELHKLNDILFTICYDDKFVMHDILGCELFGERALDTFQFLSCMNVYDSRVVIVIKENKGTLVIEVMEVAYKESCKKLFESLRNIGNPVLIIVCRGEMHDELLHNLIGMKCLGTLNELYKKNGYNFVQYLIDEIRFVMYGKEFGLA